MWQRFTERARRVVFFAQEEAGRLGENYVSSEHLLLGLCRENDTVAARILDRIGVNLGRIRSEIERQVARGDGRLGHDMQLTPRAKRIIDLAYDEARQLNNNYIGTEHILLGIIREGEGLAGRILSKLGVDLERTRREVMQLQDTEPQQSDEAESPQARDQGVPRPLPPLVGDLGRLEPGSQEGDPETLRAQIELAVDEDALFALADAFEARDHHGYRELLATERVFLVPAGTEVKVLTPPQHESGARHHKGWTVGYRVRILAGAWGGRVGFVRVADFVRTGPDSQPFPPLPFGDEGGAQDATLDVPPDAPPSVAPGDGPAPGDSPATGPEPDV
jgi:hypothetical protein